MTNVWQELDHDRIFGSVEDVLGAKLSGLLRQRNSYINRVYELELSDGKERMIVKFYRPGRWTKDQILEEHSFLKELSDKEVPAINPIYYRSKSLFAVKGITPELYFCIFPKKGGRSVDEFDKEGWQNIGRHLARIHMVGEGKGGGSKRIIWKPSVATKHHIDVLLASDLMPSDFRKSMETISHLFIQKSDRLFASTPMLLIHGDCHKGNLIIRPGEGIFLIDFDDICVGPAIQDLWMLMPGNIDDHPEEFNWFIEGYETFRNFDHEGLKLIPALRGMRLIHFASWLSIQSRDAHFDKHFPEVRTPRYWNELIKEIQGIVYDQL